MAVVVRENSIRKSSVIINWNPEPTRELTKAVARVGLAAVATAVKPLIAAASIPACGPTAPVISGFVVDRVKDACLVCTDATVDTSCATSASLGSRAARWSGCQG